MTGNSPIKELIEDFRAQLSGYGISAQTGLGTDLFNFVSSLTPIVNVDLLVYNSNGQFLLAMRDDPHCGKGWHIPGGCIRFKETLDTRIRKVAEKELNLTEFTYDKEPVKVFEIMWSPGERRLENEDERAHFISLVYKCYAPDSYHVDNGDKCEKDSGFLRWFDKLPQEFLTIQDCYREIIQ